MQKAKVVTLWCLLLPLCMIAASCFSVTINLLASAGGFKPEYFSSPSWYFAFVSFMLYLAPDFRIGARLGACVAIFLVAANLAIYSYFLVFEHKFMWHNENGNYWIITALSAVSAIATSYFANQQKDKDVVKLSSWVTLLVVGNLMSIVCGGCLLIGVFLWALKYYNVFGAILSLILAPISVIYVPIMSALKGGEWNMIFGGWGGGLLGRVIASVGTHKLKNLEQIETLDNTDTTTS